jgi:hypothetical protein
MSEEGTPVAAEVAWYQKPVTIVVSAVVAVLLIVGLVVVASTQHSNANTQKNAKVAATAKAHKSQDAADQSDRDLNSLKSANDAIAADEANAESTIIGTVVGDGTTVTACTALKMADSDNTYLVQNTFSDGTTYAQTATVTGGGVTLVA